MLPPTPHSGNISPAATSQPSPFNPSPSMRRTSSSSSERPIGLKQDVMAAEALLLYIRALAFLQRGIEKARFFWDNRPSSAYEASPDFNEGKLALLSQPILADCCSAVQWLRIRFNECYDKAEFTKARTQDEIPDSAVFTEKLIFDRALEMVSLISHPPRMYLTGLHDSLEQQLSMSSWATILLIAKWLMKPPSTCFMVLWMRA